MTGRTSLPSRVRNRLGRLRAGQPAPDEQLVGRVDKLAKQVRRLTRRVGELEEELHDARSQGRRMAEVIDVVTELLAHEASRHDPEFQRIVDKFASERHG